MKRLVHILLNVIVLCALWLVPSCRKATPVDDEPNKFVFAIVPDYGPGDNGYYDMVIQSLSVLSVRMDEIMHILLCRGEIEAETWYRGICDAFRNSSQDRALIVLAGDDYAPLVKRNPVPPENCDVLLIESGRLGLAPNIHTLELRRYGICYLAGAMVSEHEAWVIASKTTEQMTQESIQGFLDGYSEYSDDPVSTIYLIPDKDGFCQISDTRREAGAIVRGTNEDEENTYCTILPLAWTANLGIYNAVNLTVSRAQVIGMDRDCSRQNDYIPFSIVPDIGTAVYDLVKAWSAGDILPEHISEGMDSKYVYMVFSDWWDPKGAFMYWGGTQNGEPLPADFWRKKSKSFEKEALMKEKEYESR